MTERISIMQVSYAVTSRTVNVAAAATLMAEVAKRVERGSTLRALGYGFSWSPFAPSQYGVLSPSGNAYTVTLHMATGSMACTCPDYRHNGAGVCKHIAAVVADQARIERDGLSLTRTIYRTLGQTFVSGHIRNGKMVRPYVRRSRLPIAAFEAMCARYDEFGSANV